MGNLRALAFGHSLIVESVDVLERLESKNAEPHICS